MGALLGGNAELNTTQGFDVIEATQKPHWLGRQAAKPGAAHIDASITQKGCNG